MKKVFSFFLEGVEVWKEGDLYRKKQFIKQFIC